MQEKKKTSHVKAYRDIIIVQELHQNSALKKWDRIDKEFQQKQVKTGENRNINIQKPHLFWHLIQSSH